MMGLKPRQVLDFVYRNNFEECLGKDAAETTTHVDEYSFTFS